MLELFNLGISEIEIKEILETNPDLKELSDEDIIQNIFILKQIGCTDSIIKHIIISNPFYLSRSNTDIINLIKKLISIGLKNLQIFFDSNPYFLNKDDFEINDFIKEYSKKYTQEKIIDILESNPFIIEEYIS